MQDIVTDIDNGISALSNALATEINLVVLRSSDMDKAAEFHGVLGLIFTKHRHGSGPEHYSCEMGDLVFEIYPLSPR